MYRLAKIENVLRNLLGIYTPNEVPKNTVINVPAELIIRLIDQLGSYRDGLVDAKEIRNAKT